MGSCELEHIKMYFYAFFKSINFKFKLILKKLNKNIFITRIPRIKEVSTIQNGHSILIWHAITEKRYLLLI